MKLGFRFLALPLVLFYFLTPVALVFAQTPTSTPQYAPPACEMGVNPSSISVGGSVTLTWQSTGATAGSITSVGSVGPSGSINLLPSSAAQTTFVGTFTGPGGTVNCEATVTVSSGSGATSGAATTQNTTGAPLNITPTTNTTNTVTPSANGGLVPCGLGETIGTNQNDATGCQACNLAQLISLIINFCIGLSIPIAALLFAYAGVLYFTSGTNPGNIEKAKKVFKNAFIGFLIAITAWLVINTLLHALLDGGKVFSGGNWFTVQCDATGSRPVNTTINQVLSSLPMLNTSGGNSLTPAYGTNGSTALSSSGSAYSCPTGYQLDGGGTFCDDSGNCSQENYTSCIQTDSNGYVTNESPPACTSGAEPNAQGQCTDLYGNIVDPNQVPNAPSQAPSGGCSADGLAAAGGWDAADSATFSCITQSENGSCNPNAPSGTDVIYTNGTKQSVSWGLFQVNISANGLGNYPSCVAAAQAAGFSGSSLNCTQAFSGGAYTGSNHSTQVANQALYQQCVSAATNVACNTAAANDIAENQGISAWGTAAQNQCSFSD